MKKKFVVIQNVPSPFRLHLFEVMQRQLAKRDIDFHVDFMSIKEAGRPDSWTKPDMPFSHTYWPTHGIGCHFFNPGMIWKIRRERPDYLLVSCTFDTFTSIAATWLCPAKVRCAWTEGNTKTTGDMHGIKGWVKRTVLSKYPYIAAPGKEGAAYVALHQSLTKRKMPKPLLLPNLIDERRFRPRKDWDPALIASVRSSLGAHEDDRLCLIPARLEWFKGLLEFAELLTPEMLKGWRIAIIGQGSLRGELERKLQNRGLADRFQICDFVSYADMPQYYAAADLFLLPSMMDRNPLSVVEALHSALPIALSDQAGNVEEGVTDGENGWRLPVLDKTAYAAKLKDVFASDLTRLRKMGEISKTVNTKFWDSERAVAHFLDEMLADDKKGE